VCLPGEARANLGWQLGFIALLQLGTLLAEQTLIIRSNVVCLAARRETPMDQMSELKSEHMGGSVDQQAMRMIDNVIDQAVDMVVQQFPASSNNVNEIKLRMKSAINWEIHRLVSQGQQM
jgi:hypothetical protein